MNKTKFLLSALLAAGSAALFGAPENNPTECKLYGHDMGTTPVNIPCSGRVSAVPGSATIYQYEDYVPFFVTELQGGGIYWTETCRRCGAKGRSDHTGHDVGTSITGANPGGSVNSNTPGTFPVTLTIHCAMCGTVARGSALVTVVANSNPPPPSPPTPPVWPPTDPEKEVEPSLPPNPNDDGYPGENPGGGGDTGEGGGSGGGGGGGGPTPPGSPSYPYPPVGEPPVPNENDPGPYSTHRFPANAQPAYVDVFGLPLELKRPQAEEEKDQPDSFFRIDMATFMPSFSTADISIPVGNGDLKLEIRRNYNMQGKMRSLNFGHGWHSNLVSHARYPGERLSVIPTDPGPGHTSVLADVVTVTDEDGRDFNFVFAKTLGVVPDYEKAFSIDTSGGGTRYKVFTPWVTNSGESDATKTFVYLDTTSGELVWCRKYGTRYTFRDLAPGEEHSFFLPQKVTDRNGNSVLYEYDAYRRPIKLKYEQAPQIAVEIDYDERGCISEVRDPEGNAWRYQYVFVDAVTDTRILLTEVSAPPTMPGGKRAVTRYSYGAMAMAGLDQFFEELKPEEGQEFPRYIQVEKKDRIIEAIATVTYPNGSIYKFNYVDYPQVDLTTQKLFCVQTPVGDTFFTQLEACNVIKPGYEIDLTDPDWENKIPRRDMLWNYVVDINGNRWDYQFQNRVTSGRKLNADGTLSGVVESYCYTQTARMFSHSENGLPVGEPETVIWKYEVSSPEFAVNLVQTQDSNGYRTRYNYPLPVYDSTRVPGSGLGGGGACIASGYNYFAAGNVKEEIYIAGEESVIKGFDYNPQNNLMTKLVTPRGVASTYLMDARGNRLRETTTYQGQFRELAFEYDIYGNVKKSVDGDGRVTLTARTYTPTGWTDTVTRRGTGGELNLTMVRKYDRRGCLVEETDPNGNATNYEYNAYGQLIKKIEPAVDGSRAETMYERNLSGQVVRMTDPRGNVTEYRYDKLYRIVQVRRVMSGGGEQDLVTGYTYDKAGNRTSVTDPEGCMTTWYYDGLRRLVWESKPNPAGGDRLTTRYEYGENSGSNIFDDEGFKPTKIIDPKGIVTEMTYDSRFRLLTTKRDGVLLETNEYDADGNVTKKTVHNSTGDQVTVMTYDAFGSPLAVTRRMGGNAADDLVTETEYSAGGLPVRVTDPAGTVTETVYDGAGRKLRDTVKIPGGTDIVTEYAYDANGNVTSTTLKNALGGGDQTTVTAYDARNRVISVTDPEGNTAYTAYDANGNKIRETDPAGNVTDYEYDAANRLVKTVFPAVYDDETGTTRRPETTNVYDRRGLVVSSTDVRGTTTTNEYDILGRQVKSTVQLENSQQLVTENEYDALGNVIAVTTWRGTQPLVTATEYDSFNRPVKVTDPAGNSERYTCDTVGNKLTSTDKRGYVTDFTYDRANRLVMTRMPRLENNTRPTATTAYDKAGRVVAETDPNNKTSRSEYDAAGRRIKSINAAGQETVYTYDSAGNILTRTVAGQVTRYAYDKRNLQLSETLNPGDAEFERVTTNQYDSRGNRTRRIQPDGAVTDYAYDAQNRMLSAVQEGAPQETRSYTYNAAGAITFVAEGDRATGYTLDKLGRTVEERIFVKSPLDSTWIPKSLVSSVYDVVGNRLSVTYPDNRTLTSAYDLRNLLTSVSDGTRTTAYGYDAAGNRTSMLMPNGVVANYTFDSNNRLTKIAHTNVAGTNLYTAQYTLDAAGIRTAVIETGVNRANRVLAFEYDDLYQLTREADSLRNSGSPVVYAYDAMGNRTRKVDNGITTDYTVDKLNRVTAATTGVNVISYTYDANGNTASKTAAGVTRTYHYDRDNRLIRVSEGEGDEEIFTAVYDYRSRRLEKTENGDTVSYLYDGGVSVQEYDAEGSLKTYLVRAGGYGGGIGDVVYTENADGTGREYFLYNATGTTSALTDDDGAVTSTSCYTAWGIETATVGTSENVRKFSTKERSELLGIDYFGFRCYDPDLGRFLTRDPSGYPDGPNNYLYCMNSPVNKIDPLGLASRRWEDELLQKQREGLARQRYREVKADREKEAGSITGLARQRVEILEGTDGDKQIVAENSKILETGTEVASTIAKTAMEYQPAVIASKVVTGRDLDGNEISAGERLIEASAFIPIGKVVDVSYDAVKGTAKLANAAQKLKSKNKVTAKTAEVVGEVVEGAPPPNLTPVGAGRRGALRQAKRNNNVSNSSELKVEPNLDRKNNVVDGRVYVFTNKDGQEVRIIDDVNGHYFGVDNPQNRGSHFNVDIDKRRTEQHYDYPTKK